MVTDSILIGKDIGHALLLIFAHHTAYILHTALFVLLMKLGAAASPWLELELNSRKKSKYRISANSFRGNYSFLNLAYLL